MGGGSRGLRHRREDGSLATLELAARQHFAASLAVIERAVMERAASFWATISTSAARRSSSGVQVVERAFVVEPGPDPARTELVIDILLANRVEVFRTSEPVTAKRRPRLLRPAMERERAACRYVRHSDGPTAGATAAHDDAPGFQRLPEVTLDAAESFRRNQERAGYYNPKIGRTTYLFYDVTAWSMPLTFDVPPTGRPRRSAVCWRRWRIHPPRPRPR